MNLILCEDKNTFHNNTITIDENQQLQLSLKNTLSLSLKQNVRYKAKLKSFLKLDGLKTG